MAQRVVIAVDVLGGDIGPSVVLPGIEKALQADSELEVIACGPAEVVEPFAEKHDRVRAQVTTEEIAMGEHPANAVRKKKDSSLVVGNRLVKEGQAQGFFSAGSTGACLAAATLVVGRIKGVSRPALCTVIPSPVKPVVMCDVGANADCKPAYLVQFAQMATTYARQVIGIPEPKVALLNIGSEDTKGSKMAQETFELLKSEVPEFAGNGEGSDILAGKFDVFVTDGFTGNVILKLTEGVAKMLLGMLKEMFLANLGGKIAYLLLKSGVGSLKHQMDSEEYGGAPFLGAKQPVIKAHGSSKAKGIKNAIRQAKTCVENDLCGTMQSALDELAAANKPEE